MYKFLCEPLFSFLLGMYLGMKLPDHMVIISCARSVFSFLRDCQTFFDCGCTIVHFHQHCRRPVSLHSCSVQPLSRVQLCDPIDCSLPDSSIHGIFQERVLKWGAISFSRGSSWPWDQTLVSRIAGRHFTVLATRASLLDV